MKKTKKNYFIYMNEDEVKNKIIFGFDISFIFLS